MHELASVLQQLADPTAARQLERYFQVRPGGYGEGDVFLGIRLSQLRAVARPWYGNRFLAADWLGLLSSPVHEHRLVSLVVMAERATRAAAANDPDELGEVFDTYLANSASVNNWDLVDVSSSPIVGSYLIHRERTVLDELARSLLVWERRIAIISTHRFLRAGDSADAYRLAECLLVDQHDLIHKAVGWTLREAGRRVDAGELRAFLYLHAARMPRTTLRYAIEHFDAEERRHYLRQ